jgi:protein-S-isoprenylcysteine O-methyltransferase Ste14
MGPELPKYPVPPPAPPLAALGLIVLFEVVAPVPFLPRAVSLILGIPFALVSLGLWGWGMSSFITRKENPLPGRPTARLLTSGAFGVSRHPLYAGETGGLLALALVLNTAVGLAIALVAAVFARSVVIAEERYLEARYGDEYRAYRKRVRRWI